MPLWHIYTPVGAYSAEDKKALSAALMSPYVESGDLPKFYVNVLFHEVDEANFLIGAADLFDHRINGDIVRQQLVRVDRDLILIEEIVMSRRTVGQWALPSSERMIRPSFLMRGW